MPVLLNGHGPFRFLLDTGASHSAVSEDVARTIGAPAVAQTTVVSAIGTDVRVVVRLERLQLGLALVPDVLASVIRSGAIDPDGAIQGLIGQDVLAWRGYTIDFTRQCVFWHDGPVPALRGGSTFKLRFQQGRFLVELPQSNSLLYLVPDSAAERLVVFDRGRPPLLAMEPVPGYAELATLSGSAKVRQIRVRELRLGRTTLRDVAAVLVDRPRTAESEGDGLLPLHSFESVTFDGPRHLLTVRHREFIP